MDSTLSPGQLPFLPWESEDIHLESTEGTDDPTRDDNLPADDLHTRHGDAYSLFGTRELSPCMDWGPKSDAPLLSVLVIARGGPKYSLVEDD